MTTHPAAVASLQSLADLAGGSLFPPECGQKMITGAAPLADISSGDITLLDSISRVAQLDSSGAAAVVVPENEKWLSRVTLPQIRVSNLREAFTRIFLYFHPVSAPPTPGVSQGASIHPSATLGVNVTIMPRAVISQRCILGDNVTIYPGVTLLGDVQVGSDTIIFPNVTVYERCVIGKRCILHAGAVLGAYGFGYYQMDGRHELTNQFGNVVLGDDVEVGANSTIDRGTYGTTRIGDGTKIDNLVMIAHNCQIGRHNMICSQVGIAGSSSTGDYVVMAGQVGVRDHVHITSNVTLGAHAGVPKSISEPGVYLGAPAIPIQDMKRQFVAISGLGEYWREIKALAKQRRAENDVSNSENVRRES